MMEEGTVYFFKSKWKGFFIIRMSYRFITLIIKRMSEKEKLTKIILTNYQTNKTHQAIQGMKRVGFQREKGELVREILNFHREKFSQRHQKSHANSRSVTNIMQILDEKQNYNFTNLERKSTPLLLQAIRNEQIDVDFKQPLTEMRNQHLNEYVTQIKKKERNGVNFSLVKNNYEKYQVIDNFMKFKQGEETQQIEEPSNKISVNAKCDGKSFNESTMALSKFYKSQLSPHRIMRKTQNFNHSKSKSISKDKSSISAKSISKYQVVRQSTQNNEREAEGQNHQIKNETIEDDFSSCLFTLSQNQISNTQKSQTKKEHSTKKVVIHLGSSNHNEKNIGQVLSVNEFTLPLQKSSKIRDQANVQNQIEQKTSKQNFERELGREKKKASLQEIFQYEQLFDGNYEEQQIDCEQNKLLDYLKNRIRKETVKRVQMPSRESGTSSSCSFLGEKQAVTDNGIKKVSNIVKQTIKNIAVNLQKTQFQHSNLKSQNDQFNINKHFSKNNKSKSIDEAQQRTYSNYSSSKKEVQEENNISSHFFVNPQSQPSTVQKIDDKSNDKSDLFRHLEDLKDYSIAASLFNNKNVQQLNKEHVLSQLNFSYSKVPELSFEKCYENPSRHFENIREQLGKQIEIDLQHIGQNQEILSLSKIGTITDHDQSSHHPSMPSFKMDFSMSAIKQSKHQTKHEKAKRIQIELNISQEKSQTSQEICQANLDQLSNYESDEEQIIQNHSKNVKRVEIILPSSEKQEKPKSKIMLKSSNLQTTKTNQGKVSILLKESIDLLSQDEINLIDSLKNDISNLKSKISSSFISQSSLISHKKAKNISIDLMGNMSPFSKEKSGNSNIKQVYKELKQDFTNLKKRMQHDAGLNTPFQ